ncbi:MAG: winged helix-turn-helix domain-containing protein [Sandaracinaceae bacterium]
MEATASGTTSVTAEAALAAAERGDMGPAAALLSALAHDASPSARAWSAALAARCALSDDASFPFDVGQLVALSDASIDARPGVRRALASLARVAALRFDAASLHELSALHDALAKPTDERACVESELLAGWRDWLDVTRHVDLESTYRRARAAGFAAFAIEAQSLRGLSALHTGQIVEATATLRTASRMSRSEGLPDAEVLANIALASARRLQNRPHLALHIIAALRPFTPPAWRAWLDWEAGLAGGSTRAEAIGPARDLGALIHHLANGGAGVETAAERLHRPDWPRVVRAQIDLVLSLLLERDGGNDALRAWRTGASPEIPTGLVGLVFWSERGGSDPVARVLVGSGRPAYRLPELAVRRVAERVGATEATLDGGLQRRVDTGLVALAFRSEPVSADMYFAEVYGYAYDALLHGAMLSVHISRMRERLGGAGEVVRNAEGLRLRCEKPLILRDPTCSQGLDQRALRLLGQQRGMSARDLARCMTIPLRTAQRLIKQLVEDGATVTHKQGRRVVYEVEDTTFSEPTTSRRFEDGAFAPR